jgi:putative phosphoesterase
MMKIGVISDTHLRHYDERLRGIVEEYFRDVEIILHAGDLVALEVLDVFAGKEVKAVYGNMDGDDIRNRLSEKMLIELGGFRIGLIHGWGMPFGLEKKLRKQFDQIDCLVYGHTHHASNRSKDGVLYFNPGSAMDKRFAKKNTIGILEIGDTITGRIIDVSV